MIEIGVASQRYEEVLDIQSKDLAIKRLRHQHSNNDLRESLASKEQQLAEVVTGLSNNSEHFDLTQKKQKEFDIQVADFETKRKECEAKIYGGSVTSAKELISLQTEAEYLKQQQAEIEDQQLELMEQLDALEAEKLSLGGAQESVNTQLSEVNMELNVFLEDVESQILTAEQERSDAVGSISDPDLLATYEKIRKDFDGVAIAKLVNGRCEGCHMQLSAVGVDQIKKLPEDKEVNCEECGRILVR